MRDYEVLYIVRADIDDDKVQDAVKRVNTLIERSGGHADKTNLWGKRKLAYEVKHQKDGAYVLQDFQLDPDRVPELESAFKITEEVFCRRCTLTEAVHFVDVLLRLDIVLGSDNLEFNGAVYLDKDGCFFFRVSIPADNPSEIASCAAAFSIVCDLGPQ